LQSSANDIDELIIVVGDKTRPESMATIEVLKQRLGPLVVVHHQILPFAGGAIREAFELAKGSHVILMASDLETNPDEVPKLITIAKGNPNAIVATSRWLEGGSFNGYSKIKLMANWIFQRLFSTLYGTKLTDMTFGYRLYPTKILQTIKWEELRHPFFFETIVKPLRLGVEVIEIPTTWEARSEGESHNSFFRNFEYFPTGFKTRFKPIVSILKIEALSSIKN
jgi:glycosyltransferase involved in cell wall biosynthesis